VAEGTPKRGAGWAAKWTKVLESANLGMLVSG